MGTEEEGREASAPEPAIFHACIIDAHASRERRRHACAAIFQIARATLARSNVAARRKRRICSASTGRPTSTPSQRNSPWKTPTPQSVLFLSSRLYLLCSVNKIERQSSNFSLVDENYFVYRVSPMKNFRHRCHFVKA